VLNNKWKILKEKLKNKLKLQQMLEMNYLITVAPDEAGIVTGKTDA